MRVWCFGVLILSWIYLLGQGKVVFDKVEYDFGSVKEEKGFVEYGFRFLNDGDTSVQITQVTATCGCTVPLWDKEPVMKGDSGIILVRFNTVNRPGPFSKRIQVMSSGQVEHHLLTISGRVLPKPRSIDAELPVSYGVLRLKHRSLNFGKITTEKRVVKSFGMYNDSDALLKIDSSSIVTPSHIELGFIPFEIPSKSHGEIILSYDPIKKGALGYQSDRVSFITNEPTDSLKSLYAIATIEEYFPPMTSEELENAPKISISKRSLVLPKTSQGDTISTSVTIKNEGVNELIIRDIQSNCECVIYDLSSKKIEKGNEAVIEIHFDTTGRKGRQYKSLTIFSNDPKTSAQTISIRADVQVQ